MLSKGMTEPFSLTPSNLIINSVLTCVPPKGLVRYSFGPENAQNYKTSVDQLDWSRADKSNLKYGKRY